MAKRKVVGSHDQFEKHLKKKAQQGKVVTRCSHVRAGAPPVCAITAIVPFWIDLCGGCFTDLLDGMSGAMREVADVMEKMDRGETSDDVVCIETGEGRGEDA